MVDNGTPVPSGVQSWRQTVRTCCNEKVVYITTTTTTDELATYITGSGYPVWPPQEQPVVVSETSTGSTSGSGLTGVSTDAVFIGVSSTGGISSSVLFGSSGEDTIIL
jgi:hypothetical protein